LEKDLGIARSTLNYNFNILLNKGLVTKRGASRNIKYRAVQGAPSIPGSTNQTPKVTKSTPAIQTQTEAPPAPKSTFVRRLVDFLLKLEKAMSKEGRAKAKTSGSGKGKAKIYLFLVALIVGLFLFFTRPAGLGYLIRQSLIKLGHSAWEMVLPTQQEPKAIPTPIPSTPLTQVAVNPNTPSSKSSAPAPASHASKAPLAVPKAVTRTAVPPSKMVLPEAPLPSDGVFARAFCAALYNLSYKDPYADEDAVIAMLGPENGQDIVDSYYSDERMKKVQESKQTLSFKADGDPVMTAQRGQEKDFLVKGTFTIHEEGYSYLDNRPYSLLVTISHNAKGYPHVKDIVEQKVKEKE
jgi:hypothetical protein